MKFPERYSEPPYLAIVEDEGKIVAIASLPSPQWVVLSAIPDLSAVQFIVNDLYTVNKTLLRVSGLVDETKAFAIAWKILSRQSYHLNLQLRLDQLDAVQPVSGVKGHLRLAPGSDRALLIEWFKAFSREVPTHIESAQLSPLRPKKLRTTLTVFIDILSRAVSSADRKRNRTVLCY